MQFAHKVRVASNPHKRNSQPPAAKKGARRDMAKSGKRKATANGGKKTYHKPRKKAARNPSGHRRRRNPSGIGSIIGSPKELVIGGAAGLASAVATRQIPQMILGANNTGWMGYGSNLLTGLVATWAAGAFGGPAAGRGAAVGMMVILLDRVLSEQVSPLSQYLSLSGVGDAAAYSKLGTIRDGFYTHPNLLNADGSLYIPDPFSDDAVRAVVAKYPQLAAPIQQAAAAGAGRMGAVNPSALRRHTASGMLLSSRFQGRFQQQ
jgi:hypothetical protein